jgi:hypothetical protein
MTLTKGQIEEAMGRAGLVYELLEVEARIERGEALITSVKQKLKIAIASRRPEERDDLESKLENVEEGFQRLTARLLEITELLWGDRAADQEIGWRREVLALNRERALLAVEQVLRRRPEVSPPEDVDAMNLDEIRSWLVAKIGELPEEERSAWTR